MPDHSDWKERQEQRRAEREKDNEFQRKARERVALDMQYVTQSEPWNTYLEHLQAMIEAEEKSKTGLQSLLMSPNMGDPVEMNRVRNNYMLAEQRIIAFRQCMELPKRLMESPEKKNLDI